MGFTLNYINRIKGKVIIKEGELGTMIHSFSIKQLPKIVASTNTSLGVIPIHESDVKWYISQSNIGDLKKVNVEMVEIFNSRMHEVMGSGTGEYEPKTNPDGSIIICKI
jgi:hypothetical protein